MWKVAEIWTTEYSVVQLESRGCFRGSLAGPPLPRTTTWGTFPHGIGSLAIEPSALH